MMYAKSKADILIASITADIHISKGAYRPHVPQDLRALNLAAFEMIDYVVIDPNATPLENIHIIKPTCSPRIRIHSRRTAGENR